ncbi:glycosyltransferase family 2 protein [Ramaria rubella]|nr:glycosyltransferase family 2 protein [Ramaria rubella]
MSNAREAISSGDLTDLVVSSSSTTTVYPSDDTIISVLQARFRADLPYTRIGASSLVVVNPLKVLANVNDASAQEYEERNYKDTSLPTADAPKALQPHLYDIAARIYLLMRRRSESQSVLFRGITGSGKSESSRLLVNQILRLSAHSKKELRLADQVRSLNQILESFGNAKTPVNPNASRHGRYLELNFTERGRIASAKVLAYGLEKSRLNRLSHEERTYHVFYQFLAGATPDERDALGIEDVSDYALLASSGCYRLPAGPFSDDTVQMDELRSAMRTLGFKPKHNMAIFQLLITILVLGNLQFIDTDSRRGEEPATVSNPMVLDHAAHLLGVPSEDLQHVLTNRSNYVRKELYSVLLSAEQAARQRDGLVRDLYAILFAFVVETANHKIAPAQGDLAPHTQISLIDQPGFQTRGPTGTSSMAFTSPLIAAHGQNGFDELVYNFQDELVHSYVVRHTFEDTVGYNSYAVSDGVALPAVTTMDNSACVELLRGAQLGGPPQRKPGGMLGLMGKTVSAARSGRIGDDKDEPLFRDFIDTYSKHDSFVANPTQTAAPTPIDGRLFGINHYAGNCTYDATNFVEKDSDTLDSAFVSLLRNSTESFIVKLFSGPSMATEKHSQDKHTVVQAQVCTRPLRRPTRTAQRKEDIAPLDPEKLYPVTTQLNFTLAELLSILDQRTLWTVMCIRPNDSLSPNSFDKRRVKNQVRSLLLPDFTARRATEYIADYEHEAFCDRYVPTMRGDVPLRIRQCVQANGLREGPDYAMGHRSIWLSYGAWKIVEDGLRAIEKERRKAGLGGDDESVMHDNGDDATTDHDGPTWKSGGAFGESTDNLVRGNHPSGSNIFRDPSTPAGYTSSAFNTPAGYASGGLSTPHQQLIYNQGQEGSGWGSEWDVKRGMSPQPTDKLAESKESAGLIVNEKHNIVEEIPQTRARRFWIILVWLCTWWIPSFLIHHVGRMKRPDIRFAWREKVTICMLIFFVCGIILFYIIVFGMLLCPNFNKAWASNEVAEHAAVNDFWVSIQGSVYDITNFQGDHSDIPSEPVTSDIMLQLAGMDLTPYFPPPLVLACAGLVSDAQLALRAKNVTIISQQAIHTSGVQQANTGTKLDDPNWYTDTFLPKITQYRKGPLVFDPNFIKSEADNGDRIWAIWNTQIYDLTDYFNSISVFQGDNEFTFLNSSITDVFKQQPGQDITKELDAVVAQMDPLTRDKNTACMRNMFYLGETDFRKTPRCQVQNILLLVFSSLLMVTIGAKFLAALQLSGKRTPELLDKFVLCQVPCYTEGEESLRRTIDSLAALKYDDKRKLMFFICDGNIIGSGNDRPTPRIVLDILGVDPKLDPEPLLFKSVGEGSKQINYGKVYSGLYEFEGHVVPYMVIVKIGKPSERSKPGNRGKRDSQILLLHYLNRVHFDAPMSPLELEIYHQMRNVIGIDPAFYEYIFMVDADTSVAPDSLNRLVACGADDSHIIGVCGETKLDNEQGSWWTMIQVYEYYISHHLAKAFESLFGSVTCLPGCFSLYRIRTADKGRPIIISNRIIDEYSEPNVDTLHKKNLLSLGEDRFLTTLMMKHFPTYKMKFTPDAIAHTIAPDRWSILLSQRRRWINSTVHNLCELVFLPELCGFCCFSMRFIVFIDLFSTIILPATAVYLLYLIIIVSTGQAPIPIISLVMIAVVYGLQAVIFILKREFMLVGWMIIYILAYPIYSFFLPIYSFWSMDDFSWGNTRLVIGEGNSKKVIMADDEKFDDSMIPLKKFSEYEAEAWETGSVRSGHTGFSQPSGKPQSMHQLQPSMPRSESPRSFAGASPSGDFYRDTNLTFNNSSNPNLRLAPNQPSSVSMSQHGAPALPPQHFGTPQLPQMPFMPVGGGPGSIAGGSEFGGMPPMGYPTTPSMYGVGMAAGPRNTVMSNLNMFGSGMGGGSGSFNGAPPSAMPNMGMGQQRMSTFSMATSVNPFAGPSMSTDPTDEELLGVLRHYLSTQDLMTVTKKTAREAVMARFPKADLTLRKDFLNQSIDRILSEA